MNSLWRQNQPTKSKERPKFCVKCNYSIDQFVLRDLLTSFNSWKQIKGNVEAMSRQSLKQNKEKTSSTDSFQYLTTIKKEFLLFTSFSIMLTCWDLLIRVLISDMTPQFCLIGIEVIAAQMQIILVCKTQHSFPPKLLN